MGVPFTGRSSGWIGSGAWGSVSGGNLYTRLIAQTKQTGFTFGNPAASHDTTGAAETVIETQPGLLSWTGRLSLLAFTTPRAGRAGMVTRSSIGTNYIRGWTLNMRAQVHDITTMLASPPTWMDFIPGAATFDGTIEVLHESTSALDQPDAAESGGASLVLRYGDSSTDETITLNKALLQQLDISGDISTTHSGTFRFVNGDAGTVAAAGTNSIWGDNSSTTTHTFGVPPFEALSVEDGSYVGETDDIVITLASGRTLTGFAFMSGFTMTCRIGEPVKVEVDLQGRGALTPA
ncbi:MAG: hypothetical protein DWQ20_00705 [Actinobacteria bacterium]|nr:MAG: hypothetical protein DWQ20_00705 [Actinomycetota bacterium]